MFDFQGRASRPEYWYVVLVNTLVVLVFSAIHFLLLKYLNLSITEVRLGLFHKGMPLPLLIVGVLYWLYLVAVFIPSLAVLVRRLHDSGKSGWFVLLSFVPFGFIAVIVFLLKPSQEGKNKYGDEPRIADKKSPKK